MVKKVMLVLLLSVSVFTFSQSRYPVLKEIVTDSATIFNSDQLVSLRQKLTNFETQTTNQLVVLSIESLGFETIETYANATFNQNKLGQAGKDNGILILFSKNDREVRIEVGYGLEPYITDAVASRIIRNTMIPNFKEGLYYEGIALGTDALMNFLNNPEALEEFKDTIASDERKDKIWGIVFMTLFLSVFVGVGGFFFYKSYSSVVEIFRGIFIGKLGLVPGMFMAIFSIMPSLFGLVFLIMPLGFGYFFISGQNPSVLEEIVERPKQLFWLFVPFFGIAALIALIKIKLFGKEDFKLSWLKNDNSYYRKTFSSSGSHSFSSGSSGGSSSSFSGGGGSSGGGGASGSW